MTDREGAVDLARAAHALETGKWNVAIASFESLIETAPWDVPSTAWLAAGLSAICSGALPTWLSCTTVVIGAAALAIRAFPEETYGAKDVGRVLFLFVPLWFAVAGVVLWQRGGSGGP